MCFTRLLLIFVSISIGSTLAFANDIWHTRVTPIFKDRKASTPSYLLIDITLNGKLYSRFSVNNSTQKILLLDYDSQHLDKLIWYPTAHPAFLCPCTTQFTPLFLAKLGTAQEAEEKKKKDRILCEIVLECKQKLDSQKEIEKHNRTREQKIASACERAAPAESVPQPEWWSTDLEKAKIKKQKFDESLKTFAEILKKQQEEEDSFLKSAENEIKRIQDLESATLDPQPEPRIDSSVEILEEGHKESRKRPRSADPYELSSSSELKRPRLDLGSDSEFVSDSDLELGSESEYDSDLANSLLGDCP